MNDAVCKYADAPLELVAASRPARSFDNAVLRLWDTLVIWSERARQRRHLSQLDERMLKDIGLSYGDIWSEIHKPFWKA